MLALLNSKDVVGPRDEVPAAGCGALSGSRAVQLIVVADLLQFASRGDHPNSSHL
ncbi:hypothetical protein ABZW18_26995 [Streptomyces sp. NPDC004647]|uniref:hypothetical protein n=1 Tax=Streptomyces sp. NPDC004647 TaxID=3154671 RepID=UPI0033BF3549